MFDISNRCEGNGLTSPAQDTSDVGSPTPLLEEAGPDRQEGHIRYTLVDPETLTLSEIASKSGHFIRCASSF
jgi:hypothetical protein